MGEKLVVAYLVRPAEGGIKSHLTTLLAGLDHARFEPVVICPPDSTIYHELESSGERVIALDLDGDLNPRRDIIAVLALRRILSRVRPDILHIHSAKAGLVGRMALWPSLRRPRVVITMHSFVFDERVGSRKRALVSWVEKRLSSRTDRVIAVSDALKTQLVDVMGVSADKITVIPNGIAFTDVSRTAGKGLIIGTVSRLAPQKGVDNFIRAAEIVSKKYSEARFVIVGDGPLRPSLESLAGELGLGDRLEFAGHQPDALALVAAFDVFVLASTWETFGLTLVEALSQEVPVVASRVGGIPEIVDGSTTGLLAEPSDPSDLASKIIRLIEDPDLARRLAVEGCRSVRERFSSELMVDRTQQLYDKLLGRDALSGASGSGTDV